MKTYQEYLNIIQAREAKEQENEQRAKLKYREDWEREHLGQIYHTISVDEVGKMTFDYSVEIMGMMMQDFLKEFPFVVFQFDKSGNLKTTQEITPNQDLLCKVEEEFEAALPELLPTSRTMDFAQRFRRALKDIEKREIK